MSGGGSTILRTQIWILGALLVAAILAAAALRSSSELMLDPSCEPDGPIAKLKSAAQGRAFWAQQLEHLDREIAWRTATLQRNARIEEALAPTRADLDRLLAEHQQTMEETYERYPALRPSAAQQAADELRARADALERADLDARLEQMRIELIRQLDACRPVVEAKSSG